MEAKIPNNSDKALEEANDKHVVNHPVVSGKVKHRTSIGKLFMQTFIPEDVGDARDYMLTDIIMPAIKNGLFDTVLNIIDYWRGGGGSYRRASSIGAPRPRAAQGYDYSSRSRNSAPRQEPVASMRYSYEDILIEDYPSSQGGSAKARADAEGVLTCMQNTIDRYSVVRVSDLYDFVGLTGNSTDYNYGWTNIDGSSVKRVNGGWILILPKAMPIDNV